MKVVLNRCFGGFSLSKKCADFLGVNQYADEKKVRTDSRLIELVEKDSAFASGRSAKLGIVKVPDCATDWEILDYDGMESVIAVVEGKIVHIQQTAPGP